MPKFTLTAEWDGTESTVTHEFNEECLDDVLLCLDQFLRGCGYYYDGALTIEDNKTYTTNDGPSSCAWEDQFRYGPEEFEVQHSDYYYDINRNR